MSKKTSTAGFSATDLLSKYSVAEDYQALNWEGSFLQYLELVHKDPLLVRNAYQRMYDMIKSYGFEDYEKRRETFRRWKFFDDEEGGGKDAVFGIDDKLN